MFALFIILLAVDLHIMSKKGKPIFFHYSWGSESRVTGKCCKIVLMERILNIYSRAFSFFFFSSIAFLVILNKKNRKFVHIHTIRFSIWARRTFDNQMQWLSVHRLWPFTDNYCCLQQVQATWLKYCQILLGILFALYVLDEVLFTLR